jgi:hypothetical protein
MASTIGQWLVTTPWNNESIGTSGTSQSTIQRALPRSNFLSRLVVGIHLTGTGTPTLTVDRVKVLLNGQQAIIDAGGTGTTTGSGMGALRAIRKYDQGATKNGVATSTTDLTATFPIGFGRFVRDTQVILPAKIYRSVDLQITFTPGTGTTLTAQSLSVGAEELIANDDPFQKLIQRFFIVDDRSPGASSNNLIDVTPGGLLRGLMVWTATLQNISAADAYTGTAGEVTNPIEVIGNGSDIPFTLKASRVDDYCVDIYRFWDRIVPTGSAQPAAAETGSQVAYYIDFDVNRDLARCIDTNSLNRLQLHYQAQSSGQSGHTEVYQRDVVPPRL